MEQFGASGGSAVQLDAEQITSIEISFPDGDTTVTDEDGIGLIAALLSPSGQAQSWKALGEASYSVDINYAGGSAQAGRLCCGRKSRLHHGRRRRVFRRGLPRRISGRPQLTPSAISSPSLCPLVKLRGFLCNFRKIYRLISLETLASLCYNSTLKSDNSLLRG